MISRYLKSRQRLARALISSILALSVVLALLTTFFQLRRDYSRAITAIDETMEYIEFTSLQSIALGLWSFNQELLSVQLEGILHFEEIHYVEITADQGKQFLSMGVPPTRYAIVREYPLLYTHKNQRYSLGTLHVESSLSGVYQRLLERLLLILLAQAIQIFLVAFVFLVLFYLLIGRHLSVMADYAESLSLDQLEAPLHLNRRLGKSHKPDELDLLVSSINDMRNNLRRDIAKRQEAENALQEYSKHLQRMVEERTSALREAQEKLLRQEKLAVLGQLAGSVAHELRHPLGVLSNAVYFLKMSLPNVNPIASEYLEMLTTEIRKSDKIISDLLDFSRNHSGEALSKTEMQAAALLSEVLVEHPPPEGIEVFRDLAPDLPPLFVDAQQIKQVFANLLLNAYQAMPDGGTVSVSTRVRDVTSEDTPDKVSDTAVMITVRDTGCGMAPDTLKKVFEPLFTTKSKGIGLGLAICKNLVQANGGDIFAESVEGRGSAFTLEFPCPMS